MFGSDPYANLRRCVKTDVRQMKTFELAQPFGTHYRVATCAEVECRGYREDMTVTFDLTVPQQVTDANWLRNHSGLRFTYFMLDGERKVKFVIPAGQTCLESRVRPHRVPLERDPLMIVRGGDWRGNPTGMRTVHSRPNLFLENWEEDLDKINSEREKG
jgi:hypothetical protein